MPPLRKLCVDLTDELIFECVDHQHSQLSAVPDALSHHTFVLCALLAQEPPLVKAEHVVDKASLFLLSSLVLVYLGPGLSYFHSLHPLHGDHAIVGLTLIHIVCDKVHLHVSLFAAVAPHAQHPYVVVLFLDGSFDVHCLFNALTHFVLKLVSQALLIVHVLLHRFALLTQLELFNEDGSDGKRGALDRKDMDVEEFGLPVIPVDLLLFLLLCK